jgi:hypothetical protein
VKDVKPNEYRVPNLAAAIGVQKVDVIWVNWSPPAGAIARYRSSLTGFREANRDCNLNCGDPDDRTARFSW